MTPDAALTTLVDAAPADRPVVEPGLAVLTRAGSRFGVEFLDRLRRAGRVPALLVVEHTPFASRLRMARFLARKIGWRDAARYNIRFWTPLVLRGLSLGRLHPLPSYAGRAARVLAVRDINTDEVAAALKKAQVGKIVLAQSGIVRQSILSLGLPVMNAHPGSLPRYRGVDVVRWALLEEGPLESTLHLVDAGVDTGPLLERRPVPVLQKDAWQDVEKRAVELTLDMLASAALEPGDPRERSVPQSKAWGRQYYLMPFATAAALDADWPRLLATRLARTSRNDAPSPRRVRTRQPA